MSEAPRRRCHARVPLSITAIDSNAPLFEWAAAVSFGPDGIYLKGVAKPEVQLASGDELVVAFALPGQSATQNVTARVAWLNRASDGHLGLELELSGLTPRLKKRLQRFTHEHAHRVLVVDDDAATLALVATVVGRRHTVLSAQNPSEAWDLLEHEDVGVLVLDHHMPEMTGIEFLGELDRRYPIRNITKIIHSAHLETVVIEQYVNAGKIYHYLRKPVPIAELASVVDGAVEHHGLIVNNEALNAELLRSNELLKRENTKLRALTGAEGEFDEIVGRSPALLKTIVTLRQVADYPTTVHIKGATGTGKELAARAIHRASERRSEPFLAFNCAGVPESLMQSVLFGHQKGAFTGAVQDRKGLFEEADGGTVFLDEIASLSPTSQASLLRVLQEKEVVPLGTTTPRQVDTRVVSATLRDLDHDVTTGKFREDLYYRLVVFEVEMAPLRERAEDIPPLVEHFLARFCARFNKSVPGLNARALSLFERYAWPGNVRELRNEIERAVIQTPDGSVITPRELSPHLLEVTSNRTAVDWSAPPGMTLRAALRLAEEQMIREALIAADHVVAEAARNLGMDPSNLRKKLIKLGIAAR